MSRKCIIEKYLHKARFCGDKTIKVPYNDLTMMCHLALDSLHTSRWISVSERLPDDFDWYLVCGKYYSNRVAYYDLKIKTFKIDGEELFHITHWMPLPNPPEVE